MEILIDFTALILLYIFKFFKKWKSQGKDKLIVNTLIYIYISFVLFFTIMPIITFLPHIFDHPYVPMNFNAFDDVFNSRGDFIRQVVLNVISEEADVVEIIDATQDVFDYNSKKIGINIVIDG